MPASGVLKGSFWSELDDLVVWALMLTPALALAVVAIIWLGTTGLLIVVLLLVLVAAAGGLLDLF